jgi:hypothetical protein
VAGSQAFYNAKAFDANIGAWNTARVVGMAGVCAVAHEAMRTGARSGFDAAQPFVRRHKLCVCVCSCACACMCVRVHMHSYSYT